MKAPQIPEESQRNYEGNERLMLADLTSLHSSIENDSGPPFWVPSTSNSVDLDWTDLPATPDINVFETFEILTQDSALIFLRSGPRR